MNGSWTSPGDQSVSVGGVDWPCHVTFCAGVGPAVANKVEHDSRWFVRPKARTVRPPQPLHPSSQTLTPEVQEQVGLAEVVGDTTGRDLALKKWAGQLNAYRSAIEAATGRPVLECWIHLPVRGEVVRLEIPR